MIVILDRTDQVLVNLESAHLQSFQRVGVHVLEEQLWPSRKFPNLKMGLKHGLIRQKQAVNKDNE